MSIQHPKYRPYRPQNNDYSGMGILDIHDPNFSYKNTSYSAKDDSLDSLIEELVNIRHPEAKPYYTRTKFFCPFCRTKLKGAYDLIMHMNCCTNVEHNIPKLELKIRHLEEFLHRTGLRIEELDLLIKEGK